MHHQPPTSNVIAFPGRTRLVEAATPEFRIGDKVRFRLNGARGTVYDARPDFGTEGRWIYYVMLSEPGRCGLHVSALGRSLMHDDGGDDVA